MSTGITRDTDIRGVWFDEQGWYEAAFVYALPDDVQAAVERLRSRHAYPSRARFQLEPHLTLLFLGQMRGAQLARLVESLGRQVWEPLLVRVGGIGAFRRERRITNIHFRIEPAVGLLERHRRALELCSRYAWFSPGSYVGDNYAPHVSIFDNIDVAEDGLAALEDDADARVSAAHLTSPHVLSIRLDPQVIARLPSAAR